jgi:hypothetical protein
VIDSWCECASAAAAKSTAGGWKLNLAISRIKQILLQPSQTLSGHDGVLRHLS